MDQPGSYAPKTWTQNWHGAAYYKAVLRSLVDVAEAPWSEAEWAVARRFDNPRATVLVLVLG